MAASSLLLLIDDIATVLDDVAILSKVAAKKTAGVLGDDLALNAQQVAGVRAERELPVVWAVAKGSFRNKAILVPAALLISALAPWAVIPLLMMGGAYLCFEGFEKVLHTLMHFRAGPADAEAALLARVDGVHSAVAGDARAGAMPDLQAIEQEKIRGAIRTDFILSAEIIVIALGIVAAAPFMTQVAVISAIAIAMTIGVYGLVAGIVKLDDLGLYLTQGGARPMQRLGYFLLAAAPWMMKGLSVAGTAAMFLVGGGILTHGVAPLHHFVEAQGVLLGAVLNGGVGVLAGALLLAVVAAFTRLRDGLSRPA